MTLTLLLHARMILRHVSHQANQIHVAMYRKRSAISSQVFLNWQAFPKGSQTDISWPCRPFRLRTSCSLDLHKDIDCLANWLLVKELQVASAYV